MHRNFFLTFPFVFVKVFFKFPKVNDVFIFFFTPKVDDEMTVGAGEKTCVSSSRNLKGTKSETLGKVKRCFDVRVSE